MSQSSITWHQPSHPDLISVRKAPGAYSWRAVSLVSAAPGTILTKITNVSPTTKRTYTSVQTSRTGQVELHSDIVFCNHSCRPSIIFDMVNMELRVVEERALKVGDDLTFFYPSSEWDMAQTFDCSCGVSECVGLVKGAKDMEPDVLRRYWLNSYIAEMLIDERKQSGLTPIDSKSKSAGIANQPVPASS